MQKIIGKKAIIDVARYKKINKVVVSNKDKKFIFMLKKYCSNITINNDKAYYDSQTNNQFNHQFAIAWIDDDNTINNSLDNFLYSIRNKYQSTILIVDSLNDPNNFGSIIRTCECLGVDAIIYKNRNQVGLTSTVMKTSMGAHANINLFKIANISNIIDLLKKNNFWIYATSLDNKAIKINDVRFYNKIAIIVGNENNGISELLKKKADFNVYIPMFGKTQSLNVSVATGIILFESIKSRS